MGFKDEKANDGKGGWSDQGAGNDAANFKYNQKEFAGIPFHITDPGRNEGKSVLVLK